MKISYALKRFYQLLRSCIVPSFNYLKHGYQSGQLKAHCLSFAKSVYKHLQLLGSTLDKEHLDSGNLQGARLIKLHQLTLGLHQLMPPSEVPFSYSILIPLKRSTNPLFFQKALFSALQQTAPNLEILISYSHDEGNKAITSLIEEYKNRHPGQIKVFSLNASSTAQALNFLAKQAEGYYLLPLNPQDWIRPDFLFRCEQLLRFSQNKEKICIYTNEYEINEHDYNVPGKQIVKSLRLTFPYIFYSSLGRSFLIPRQLWNLTEGISIETSENELFEDLALKLDLIDAEFHHLPFYLYARRVLPNQTESLPISSSLVTQLEKYTTLKNLVWTWEKGMISQSYRAIPKMLEIPKIQVIIPFKNQREITLKTVHSILKQKNVQIYITAVDNDSQDKTIAADLQALGCEVLLVKEPFNYSRLNNIAVSKTSTAQECELVLFLNNDVELEENALEEMCRWIYQPRIGMVGCQLLYPNGLLQHGGIDIKRDAAMDQVIWNHSEKLVPADRQKITKIIRIADGVTAACALMKKQLFLDIGGFDEIWYPIAYSDTNLAIKLEAKGLYCLYTPYAKGVHHESLSRCYGNIEDVEISRWLQNKFQDYYQTLQSNLK